MSRMNAIDFASVWSPPNGVRLSTSAGLLAFTPVFLAFAGFGFGFDAGVGFTTGVGSGIQALPAGTNFSQSVSPLCVYSVWYIPRVVE